jgi:hypothetical protein
MSHPTRTLISFAVACLLLCANGERIATAQTVADDTANPPRIELEMILQKLQQQNERDAHPRSGYFEPLAIQFLCYRFGPLTCGSFDCPLPKVRPL